MDKFFERQITEAQSRRNFKILNSHISVKEIDFAVKNLPTKKTFPQRKLGPESFSGQILLTI